MPFFDAIFNNFSISYLDNTDFKAMSKFMDKYKKVVIKNEKYSISEIDRLLDNTQKLLSQEKLVIAVGYNLLGSLVGYMAVDLQTGVCIFYYISYTGGEFSKIYKNLLQALEYACKKKGLKTLVIPIVSSQIYQEDILFSTIDSQHQNENIQEAIIKVLKNLGYEPLQGWSKFKHGFKGLFLTTYQYDSAWSKNL